MTSIKLKPYFITGLTEAEGSFSISKHKDIRAKYGFNIGLRFKITMLTNETELIHLVKDFWGCGTISYGNNGTINFEVKDIYSIDKFIIPHFTSYSLRGIKYLDYVCFKETVDIIKSKKHLTEEGLNEVIIASKGMNSYRVFEKDYCPAHTLESNREYIAIDGDYVNGFIAGDGCLALNTNDVNFCRMSLQISQHKYNKNLLLSIANYFESPSKIYYHDTNSLQLTLSGKKLWNNVIFNHFNNYRLYGSKIHRLNKLIEINNLMLNNNHLMKVGKYRLWNPEIKKNIIHIWHSE